MRIPTRRTLAGAVAVGVAAAGLSTLPAAADPQSVHWTDCIPEGKDDPAVVKGSQCATLQLPVDWRHPNGPTFGLAIARRTAEGDRTGVLVFGPGGPGDSGVDRIKTGMDRFSDDLQDRFDVVSFDPRGIARSNAVKCSADLLAEQPSPIVKSPAAFQATIDYNRMLAADCRAHTGPLYDHIDSWQTVRDVDAIRRALGERQITFHGSSYGTLLGAQYADTYPSHVRAMVLESVIDHSVASTRSFVDAQGAAGQDSFDEFVKWCAADASCALHGADVHAVWAKLLADSADPFGLSFRVFRMLYGPQWPELAQLLKGMETAKAAPAAGAVASYPLAVFCQDWNLPVRSYREYAGLLARLARANQDMKYPGQFMAVSICLGSKANNPQHAVSGKGLQTKVLVANAIHDPATPYPWAQSVARQLGGVLLTYDGWGHGSYTKGTCMQATVDNYLINKVLPRRGTHCPAVPPVA